MRPRKRVLVYCKDEIVGSHVKFLLETVKPKLASTPYKPHLVNSADALRAMMAVMSYDAVLLWKTEDDESKQLKDALKIPMLIVSPPYCRADVWMEDLYFLTRKKTGPKKVAA